MTKAELIEALKEYPNEMEVVIENTWVADEYSQHTSLDRKVAVDMISVHEDEDGELCRCTKRKKNHKQAVVLSPGSDLEY